MSYCNVGIDLGVTSKHEARIRDEHGKEIGPKISFYLSRDSLDDLCNNVLQVAPQGIRLRFICEPTGMSWFPLAIYCRTRGYKMVRVKSQKSHALRKYFALHKKNNSLDARVLSVMPVIDEEATEEIYLPNAKAFSLKRRSNQMQKINQEISSIKNRISSIFHWVMPGLLDCFDDPFDSRARAFYLNFSSPFKAMKAGIESIKKVLAPACRQRMREGLVERIYQVVQEACRLYEKSSAYVDFDEIQDEVLEEIALLDAQEKSLIRVKERVKQLYEEVHPSRNIETLRGISKILGPSLIGIIGDPQRFSSQANLRSFAGLVPKQDDSGDTSKKGLSLTQEGPSSLRRNLYLASDVARQWDPQLAKVYYEEMVNKGHCHTQAVCAVMTRITNRILCILKENRPYQLRDPDGNPISKQKAKQMIKERFTVPEEIRQRTRNRKREKDKSEERLYNFFKRQIENQSSQKFYKGIPLENRLMNIRGCNYEHN